MTGPARPLRPEELLAHAGWVRALARRLLRDEASVDDVVQETWLAAMEKGPRNPQALPGWLATVVRNFALKARRGERRRLRREEIGARPEGLPATGDVVERGEALGAVVQAVLELPDPCRSVLLHHYFDELKPREIAREMGLPETRVRTLLRTGRDLLRERLDRRFGDWRQPCLAVLSLPQVAAAAGTAFAWKAAAALAGTAAVAATAFLLLPGPWRGPAAPDIPAAGERVPTAFPASPDPAALAAAPPEPVVLPLPPARRREAGSSSAGGEVLPLEILAVDSRSGEPVPDLGLVLAAGERRLEEATDPAGRLRWELPRQASALRIGVARGEPWATLGATWDLELADDGRTLLVRLPVLPAASLSGRLLDATGRPVPGAVVAATAREGWLRLESLDPEQHPLTRTDLRGHFRLEGFLGHGFLHVLDPQGREYVALLELAPGEARERDLRLPRLEEDLLVEVLDARGAPVEGATVQVLIPGAETSGGLRLRTSRGRTGSEGRFRAPVRPPEGLPGHVLAEAEGYAAAGRLWDGDTDRLTLVLPDRPRIEGRVLDASGTPVGGAEVALWLPRIEGETLENAGPGDWQTARTDAQGRFGLTARSTLAGCLLIHAPGHGLLARSPFQPQDRNLLELQLPAEHVLAGRVLPAPGEELPSFEELRLRVRGEIPLVPPEQAALLEQKGRPVPVAEDFLASRLHPLDPEGSFRIGGLAPGYYELELLEAGSGRLLARARVEADPAASPRPFPLLAGQGLPETLSLEGEVVDARTGAPVPSFRLWLRAADGPRRLVRSAEQIDTRGHFRVAGLAPGLWALEIEAEGYAPGVLPFSRREPGREKLRVELWPPAGLELRLLDRNGRPLAGLPAVLSLPEGAERPLRSDEDGWLRAEGLPAAPLELVIEPGGRELRIPLDLGAGPGPGVLILN